MNSLQSANIPKDCLFLLGATRFTSVVKLQSMSSIDFRSFGPV